jgi:hypothetical protein
MAMNDIAEYVGRTYTYGGEMRWTIGNEQKCVITIPSDLDAATTTSTQQRIWETHINEYVKRDIKMNENCEKLYSLILGQCTEYIGAKFESVKYYEMMMNTFDVITLIKSIK